MYIVTGQVVLWCCPFSLSLDQRNTIVSLPSHSLPNHAWITSLSFWWNLAAIPIIAAGVYSLIVNVFWIGGCPLAGIVLLLLDSMRHLVQFIVNHQSIFLFTFLNLPKIIPLNAPIMLCYNVQTFICDSFCSPKVENGTLSSSTYYCTFPIYLPALKPAE